LHLTVRGVVRYGVVSLFVVATLSDVVLLQGMMATRIAVERMRSEERETAAAFELEINALGTGLAVVAYLDTGDSAHLKRIEKDRRDFAFWIGKYRQSADRSDMPLAKRAAALYDEFYRLGLTMIREYQTGQREKRKIDVGSEPFASSLQRFSVLRTQIDDLLDDEMQASARAGMVRAERDADSAQGRMRAALILSSVLFAGVLLVLLYSSVMYVSRPLNRLLEGTRAITAGDLAHRINLVGRSEFAVVGEAIDKMLQTLQETMVFRDEIVSVNRQLRTVNEELSTQIDQRRTAQEQQRISEERYRSIFERSPTAIFRMTIDGTITEANRSFARTLGESSVDTLHGRRISEILGDTKELATLFEQLGETGVVDGMEIPVQTASGSTAFVVVTVAIATDDTDSRIFYEGTLTDITERKLSWEMQNYLQERLTLAAQEWSWTFDSISDLVIVLDQDGRISRINEASRLVAGCEFSSCVGVPVHEVYGELGRRIEQLSKSAILECKPQTSAARDTESGASWSLLVSPRLNAGVAEGIVAVARDLSYMEGLEATVRQSQRMAEMGSFVAGVAHEVRNPLFGITANLDAMDLALNVKSESLEFSQRIRSELGRLSELMRDLLDYARPSAENMELTSVREVVLKSIAATEIYARQAKVSLECKVDERLGRTIMNGQRVRQALQNLIENAVVFAPPGSVVMVEASGVDSYGENPFIKFAVTDSGPGFRAEDIPHAFEPFFTKRRGGTGLGLSIVRRVAEDHGGSVSIINAASGGATVNLMISVPGDVVA